MASNEITNLSFCVSQASVQPLIVPILCKDSELSRQTSIRKLIAMTASMTTPITPAVDVPSPEEQMVKAMWEDMVDPLDVQAVNVKIELTPRFVRFCESTTRFISKTGKVVKNVKRGKKCSKETTNL